MLLSRKALNSTRQPAVAGRNIAARGRVVVRAGEDTNLFVNLLASGACGAIAAAVTLATHPTRDAEIERVQTVEGAAPIAAAVAADAVAHSIPGLNLLFGLLTEPAGAACGVAYMMTLVLSAKAVDPKTLAPEGTIVNAKTAEDSRAGIRIPYSQLIPTALEVVDTTNQGYTGAGWTIGPNGLPKLPLNSVLIVVGVGAAILEAASHAPVLSLFMPRVLTNAFWLAAVGYGFNAMNKK